MKKIRSPRFDKTLAIVVVSVAVVAMILVAVLVGIPAIKYISEPETFREMVNQHGIKGRLLYIGMTMLQIVVAILPGEPFEIAAGYAFGAWEGTFLCIFASGLGSVAAFLMVKVFGRKVIELFFTKEKIESVAFLNKSNKLEALLFIIFLIPMSPKDLLCYYAGLTQIPVWRWSIICTIGRIPSIITSTIAGGALGSQNYTLTIISFALAIFMAAIGGSIYAVVIKREKARNAEETKE